MRILALDVGARRIGLAVSDSLALLARPLKTIDVSGHDPVERVAEEITRLAAEEDGLGAIVVGMPRRLDGSDGSATGAGARRSSTPRRRP
jgi:putative Holliday junction resolvase